VHCRKFLRRVYQRIECVIGFHVIIYPLKTIHESLGRFLDDDEINIAARVRLAARRRAEENHAVGIIGFERADDSFDAR